MTANESITAYLCLGSNKGKREHFLRDALKAISEHPAITVTQVSQIYETEPWGRADQPWFLNQVVAVQTSLKSERLLKFCQGIEKKVGRMPMPERWVPREIDVDILLYGDQVLRLPELEVPHPHLCERRFALVPLVEIAPSLRDPETRKTFKMILKGLNDPSKINLYK